MKDTILDTDLIGLPIQTSEFVTSAHNFGFDRVQIHGIFVLLGLNAGTPRSEEEISDLFHSLDVTIPIDRTENLDDRVGHFYTGYEHILGEFCFRLGVEFDFRVLDEIIEGERLAHGITTLDVKNHNQLDTTVENVTMLADSTRLYGALLTELGQLTSSLSRSLADAFSCGIFQIQLIAGFDASGACQISHMINRYRPIFLKQLVEAVTNNQLDYFLNLNALHIPLIQLMGTMENGYARQLWAFQSWLCYENQKPIEGVLDLNPREWHHWVVQQASKFDNAYPEGTEPFSRSGTPLDCVPLWGAEILEFEKCDSFVSKVWGYQASDIFNEIELSEYRALVVHTVYASLTSNKELLH